MVSISPLLLLFSSAAGQTKEEWAQGKIGECKQLAAAGNYKESIRQAGLIMDQLYNGGDGSVTDLYLLRSLKSAIKKGSAIAIATGKVYCPLPSTYLTFAINSLPQAIKDSHDSTLQAKYILFTMAMIHAESRFDAKAKNPKDGATGLGQLKPATAAELLGGTPNLTDPATNIRAVEAHIYRLFLAEFACHYPGQLMNFRDDSITMDVVTTYGGAEANKVMNLFGIYQLLYRSQLETRLATESFNQLPTQ